MTHEMSEQNNSKNSNLHEECSPSSRLPDLSRIRAYYDETWLATGVMPTTSTS